MALVELRISGLAVLRSVRLTFSPGLCALTGETGTGKSLCLAGLRLALGHRVDVDAPEVRVAAVFDELPPAVGELLQAHGIACTGELLTLSRDLRRGRSTCRIDGALVPIGLLRRVGDHLVEVTAQGESRRLTSPAYQRSLVDAFGGTEIARARAEVVAALSTWQAARAGLAESRARAARWRHQADAARATVAELEPLRLRPGEREQLLTEATRLRRAGELVAAATSLAEACAAFDDEGGAADTLARSLVATARLHGVDAGVDALRAAVGEEVVRLRDLAAAARRLAASLATDEERLVEVEARLDVLDRVSRRYGSAEAALATLETAQRLLVENDDARLAEATAAVADAEATLAEAAERLSRRRRKAAAGLEDAICPRLRGLGLPQAQLRILVGRRPDADGLLVGDRRLACDAGGIDVVDMRLAVDGGVPLPLDRLSGGELSRVALGLRSLVAAADDCPTLVLDEVDTGIGGHAAARVGEVLAAVAEGRSGGCRQVLVVTHRPEIAARAGHHLVVRRDAQVSVVEEVSDEARVAEVARLLSGRATAAALARARELLLEGNQGPAGQRRSASGHRQMAARTIASR